MLLNIWKNLQINQCYLNNPYLRPWATCMELHLMPIVARTQAHLQPNNLFQPNNLLHLQKFYHHHCFFVVFVSRILQHHFDQRNRHFLSNSLTTKFTTIIKITIRCRNILEMGDEITHNNDGQSLKKLTSDSLAGSLMDSNVSLKWK